MYQNPQDLRVAEFVGSPKINVLPGECDSAGRLSCRGVALERRLEKAVAGPVSIGWRPEHFALRAGKTSGCFGGRLVYKENLGADVYLHAALADGAHRIIARVTPAQAHDAAVGDELWLDPDGGRTMAFGPDGRRLALVETGEVEQVA